MLCTASTNLRSYFAKRTFSFYCVFAYIMSLLLHGFLREIQVMQWTSWATDVLIGNTFKSHVQTHLYQSVLSHYLTEEVPLRLCVWCFELII